MAAIQYLALLRGINVGGKNIIKMADLKAFLEAEGFANVATYIQSGNILFASSQADQTELTRHIESALSKEFSYQSRIVLRSHQQMKNVVKRSPGGFGSQPDLYRYDVIFLKEPVTAAEAIRVVTLKEGVDTAHTGPGVLYFSRLTSKAAQSRLSRIVTLPIYQSMTIRNWNTTTRLLALMDSRAS